MLGDDHRLMMMKQKFSNLSLYIYIYVCAAIISLVVLFVQSNTFARRTEDHFMGTNS
jgi:hypothetical protein